MIQLENVSLIRGGKQLLHNASLTVHHGQRIGLTGANGCGKSSLFSLLLGEISCDAGEIFIPKDLCIAHMQQEVEALDRVAIDYVLDGDKKFRSIEQAIAQAEERRDYEALSQWYDHFEMHGGYAVRSKAEQLLYGLGFVQNDLAKPVAQFSGGWRMRLNLAYTLMCPSNLLLLDEPTNHLDLEAILWLEAWLKKYSGTLIIISHDRTFLDNVVGFIAHIEHASVTLYKGSYSIFEKVRAEKLLQQQSLYEKQKKQRAHLQQFIDRFKAKATKARQAQSRVKMLAKMESRLPAYAHSPFSFHFEVSDHISDPLLRVREGVVGYGENVVLHHISMDLHPGSRIALLGSNGTGKSTLLKSLAERRLLKGQLICGEYLKIGYFAQHQLEHLDVNISPFLHIQRLSPDAREQNIRTFLGTFGFCGEEALAAVKHFSGGERARLSFALIAWQQPNVLLLDEPTNHLDLDMRHALTIALQAFEGAVLLISHDRALLDTVADELWHINDKSQLELFADDLNAYLIKQVLLKGSIASSSSKEHKLMDKKQRRVQEAKHRDHINRIRKEIANLECDLSKIQKSKEDVDCLLVRPELYGHDDKKMLLEALQEQKALHTKIQTLETRWIEKNEQLEALKTNLKGKK